MLPARWAACGTRGFCGKKRRFPKYSRNGDLERLEERKWVWEEIWHGHCVRRKAKVGSESQSSAHDRVLPFNPSHTGHGVEPVCESRLCPVPSLLSFLIVFS